MTHFLSVAETAESTDRGTLEDRVWAQYREVGGRYRCRMEFEADGRRFIEAAGITRFHFEPLVPERHVLHHAPDRLLTFTSDKDLGQLIRIAAKIVDNHVLAETLMPLDKYTPDRSSLRVFLAHRRPEEYVGPLCEVAGC